MTEILLTGTLSLHSKSSFAIIWLWKRELVVLLLELMLLLVFLSLPCGFGLISTFTSHSTIMVMTKWSVHLATFFSYFRL